MRVTWAEINRIRNIINSGVDEFIVFDIETTGFTPRQGGKITEICAVKIKTGRIVAEYHQLINPERRIPYQIVQLTGITDNMVRNKPTIREVLPEFLDFIGDNVLVAHNGQRFDKPFVSYFTELYFGHVLENQLIDTVTMARYLLPGLENHRLDTLAKELNVRLDCHHRAIHDAKANADIFLILYDMFLEKESENVERQNLVSENAIKSIRSWRKGSFNRLYVNLNNGAVYYDFLNNTWSSKDFKGLIDYKALEMMVLDHLKISSMKEIMDKEIKWVV